MDQNKVARALTTIRKLQQYQRVMTEQKYLWKCALAVKQLSDEEANVVFLTLAADENNPQ